MTHYAHYHDEDGGPVWPLFLVIGVLLASVVFTGLRG